MRKRRSIQEARRLKIDGNFGRTLAGNHRTVDARGRGHHRREGDGKAKALGLEPIGRRSALMLGGRGGVARPALARRGRGGIGNPGGPGIGGRVWLRRSPRGGRQRIGLAAACGGGRRGDHAASATGRARLRRAGRGAARRPRHPRDRQSGDLEEPEVGTVSAHHDASIMPRRTKLVKPAYSLREPKSEKPNPASRLDYLSKLVVGPCRCQPPD